MNTVLFKQYLVKQLLIVKSILMWTAACKWHRGCTSSFIYFNLWNIVL